MPDYRLMSTRHLADGSIETPSTIRLSAGDDREATDLARRYPLEDFVEAADYAWLVGEDGTVVCAFPVGVNRAA